MSLILEALRKSEAERRLGNAPDVLAAMPVMHAPDPVHRWRLIAICASLLLIATIALTWWSLRATPSRTRPVAVTQPTRAASDSTSSATLESIPEQEHQDSAHAVLAERLQTTRRSPITLPAVPMHPVQAQVAVPRAPPQNPTRPGDSHSTPKADTAFTTTPSVATPPPLPAPVPPPVAPIDEPALMPVSDLPASERSALPALVVTMHVYADNPAQRFMIVDGQRVGEGSRLGEGIVIVRIRHDGAEIDARGRHLLLPNP